MKCNAFRCSLQQAVSLFLLLSILLKLSFIKILHDEEIVWIDYRKIILEDRLNQ